MLKRVIVIAVSFGLVLALLLGLAVVDNQIKISQNNPFLNTFLIDFSDKFLFLRFFNLSFKLSFGLAKTTQNIIAFSRPIFSVLIVVFSKIFIY